MPWDVVVLDERQASKSFATKMYPVLHDLGPRQRLSMRDSPADAGPEQLLAWASFLEPNGLKVRAAACCAPHTAAQACFALLVIACQAQRRRHCCSPSLAVQHPGVHVCVQDPRAGLASTDAGERAAAAAALSAAITPYVRTTRRADLQQQSLPRLELQVPVPLSVTQAESYRMTLAKQFEQLGNHKAQRHSGQRASMLRSLCADVCRVCDHPYTQEQFEPEADAPRSIADFLQARAPPFLFFLTHFLQTLTAFVFGRWSASLSSKSPRWVESNQNR